MGDTSIKEPNEKIQILLKQVVDHFDKEDRFVRERQIRLWKKLKYYWNGFQRLWWSEVAHDWRVFDVNFASEVAQASDSSFYDKPVNIFRAYLESIIAALSITIPTVRCYPDDADNALDLATAKAGDKIAELVGKHNDVSLLWLHALFIYCTEGMVACYTYPKESYDYGQVTVPKYEESEDEVQTRTCPECKTDLPPPLEHDLIDEYQPGDDDVELHDLLFNSDKYCAKCAQEVEPEIQNKKIVVTRQVGITTKPKTRQCMEVYGGLYVKVPNYAMKQADCPYLIFAYETHYSNAVDRYPNLRDKFTGQSKIGPGSGGMYDPYERWGRLSTQYFGEYPTNTTTIRNTWLRPSSFNILNDEDDVKLLKKHYPDGAKVVLVNDEFAEAENESLDDCWTLTQNPLSDYIHYDPLGLLLTSIQEITNDLVSLVVQTIEHGIPQTFADPGVVNFEAYRQSEVLPGSLTPTKPGGGGKRIEDGFFTIKTASLSGEVLPFSEKVQELGQLVTGALPSLFGGQSPGQSKTAAVYAMSRSQALQRLQTPWKMFNIWWKTIFGKVIPAFIESTIDDEKFVSKDDDNNFFNVFIKKAELQGKLGSVELESSEEYPMSWGQKKDVIMQLLQASNPEVMSALTAPENIHVLADAIGLTDFAIPGEDDREKQYEEIRLLIQSAPIPDGQGGETSSVEVEPLVDNHQIEGNICRTWLVGPAGRLAKTDNPDGYKNVLLHLQKHAFFIQQQMQAQQQGPPQQGNQPPQNKGPQSGGKVMPFAAKLPQGASNVSNPQ